MADRGEARARALMAQMTLDEKIGQLNLLAAGEGLVTGAGQHSPLALRLDQGQVGAIFGSKSRASARGFQERALAGSRLKIPLFFAEDVIHGHRTVFPLPIALACSWDMALIRDTAGFAAREAFAEGLHQVYSPMIDVARDARWGRIAEGPGEDPWLGARIAEAMVAGYQGEGPGEDRVSACLKHFVAYGATQSGRDYDNASMAWEDLLEIYLPPFAAGVEAGAESAMASFNAVNKVPMHAHEGLIEGWLRAGQGFDGLMVSDYTGVKELTAHGLGTGAEVVARALHAGIDMDMVGEDFLSHLPSLAEDGVTMPGLSLPASEITRLIDRACLRVLVYKIRLGLFENPFLGMEDARPYPDRGEGRALARRAAAGSAVLLKNDGILPLKPGRKLALIGPFAADQANMLGTWAVSGRAEDVVPLDQAFRDAGWDVSASWGANIVDPQWLVDRLNVHGVTVRQDRRSEAEQIAEAVAAAQAADVVVLAVGEAKEQAGESSSVTDPVLPAPQRRLAEALAATGKPVVVCVFAGRPLALEDLGFRANALLYAWHGGIGGPAGVVDVLTGAVAPAGRLAVTLPPLPGMMPESYADETTGRPNPGHWQKFLTGWLDLPDGAPGAYPFGFGLGYGRIEYDTPRLDDSAAEGREGHAVVTVSLRNAGTRAMTETVQLYLSDPEARITRPSRWLADCRRLDLAPGETREVRFTVPGEALAYWVAPSLAGAEKVWDPGRVLVHVGPNSRDTTTVGLNWRA